MKPEEVLDKMDAGIIASVGYSEVKEALRTAIKEREEARVNFLAAQALLQSIDITPALQKQRDADVRLLENCPYKDDVVIKKMARWLAAQPLT